MSEEHFYKDGAVIDTRPVAEKLKDYKFEELVSSAEAVNWTQKTPDQIRKFPIFDQT